MPFSPRWCISKARRQFPQGGGGNRQPLPVKHDCLRRRHVVRNSLELGIRQGNLRRASLAPDLIDMQIARGAEKKGAGIIALVWSAGLP